MSIVKIVTFVPIDNADMVREVLGEAGAGVLGEYSFCSYSVVGSGHFLPSEQASPYIGKSGKMEVVEEERIEVTCEREKAKDVVMKLKSVHPYEEVAVDIYPILEESEL